MTMTAEERERQRVYNARWRKRHPDQYAAMNRDRAKVRRVAERALVAEHRDEYDALLAAHADKPSDPRQRAARRDLRLAHPDEWRDLLAAAREENR